MKAGNMFFRVGLLVVSIASLMMTNPALSEVPPKKVSVKSEGKPWTLLDALAAIEKRHGITFFIDEAVAVTRKVEAPPEDAAVETSLHKLLGGYDYFLQFGPDVETDVNKLKRVWVFPRSTAEAIELVSREDLLQTQENCPTPDCGQTWLESIQASPDGGDQIISDMLISGNEVSQNEILDAARRSEIFIPRPQLENLLRNDPSEEIRAKAFSLLIMHPASTKEEEQAISDLALTDPSSSVREMARQYQEQQAIFSDENAEAVAGSGRPD